MELSFIEEWGKWRGKGRFRGGIKSWVYSTLSLRCLLDILEEMLSNLIDHTSGVQEKIHTGEKTVEVIGI